MSRPNLRATQANAAPAIFLELSAHGSDIAPDQRSPLRRALLLSAAFLLLVSAPLYWAGAAQGSEGEQPQAVVSKSGPNEGEDEGDDDGDAGTDLDTGAETQGQHRRRHGCPVHRALDGWRDRPDRHHRGHGADPGHRRGDPGQTPTPVRTPSSPEPRGRARPIATTPPGPRSRRRALARRRAVRPTRARTPASPQSARPTRTTTRDRPSGARRAFARAANRRVVRRSGGLWAVASLSRARSRSRRACTPVGPPGPEVFRRLPQRPDDAAD